jgi:hypothetical protein
MMSEDSPSSARAAMFIAGMPRAATTWLCKCFNEHPQTAGFGESMFFGRRYVQPGEDGRYSQQQLRMILKRLGDGTCIHAVNGDGVGCLKRVSRENLADVIEAGFASLTHNPTPTEVFTTLLDTIAHAEGKQRAVEKTPHHLNWVDRIVESFPNARIVIMLREPYSFMLSYKHQGDRKSLKLRKTLRRLYHPMACAMIWRASMRSALAAQEHYPDHVLLVNHERVKESSTQVLDEVQQFFGLEPVDLASRMPRVNSSFSEDVPSQPRPSLRADDVFWMNRIAGRIMARAGYKQRKAPLQPLPILWSILRLPIWGINCAWILSRKVEGSFTRYFLRWFRPAKPRQSSASPS